jgi:hypothetical protein
LQFAAFSGHTATKEIVAFSAYCLNIVGIRRWKKYPYLIIGSTVKYLRKNQIKSNNAWAELDNFLHYIHILLVKKSIDDVLRMGADMDDILIDRSTIDVFD